MGEVQGDVYRLGSTTSMFQADKQTVKSGSNMKKTGSQLLLALSGKHDEDEDTDSEEESKTAAGLGLKVRSSNNLSALAV